MNPREHSPAANAEAYTSLQNRVPATTFPGRLTGARRVAYATALYRRRQAAARSAPHWGQRQRVSQSAGGQVWRAGDRTRSRRELQRISTSMKSRVCETQLRPPLPLSSLARLMTEPAKLRTPRRPVTEGSSLPGPPTFSRSPSLGPITGGLRIARPIATDGALRVPVAQR